MKVHRFGCKSIVISKIGNHRLSTHLRTRFPREEVHPAWPHSLVCAAELKYQPVDTPVESQDADPPLALSHNSTKGALIKTVIEILNL